MKSKAIIWLIVLCSQVLHGQSDSLKIKERINKESIICYRPITPKSEKIDTTGTRDFENKKGKLIVPADNYISIDNFQKEEPGKQISDPELDLIIRCKPKANAIAVANGKVTGIVCNSNNWFVIVRHGSYFSVYSNIDTVYVKKNQMVAEKQKIGAVSMTDGETILKFGIWLKQEKMDPMNWIKKTKK